MAWPSTTPAPQAVFPPELINVLLAFEFSPTQRCVVDMLRHSHAFYPGMFLPRWVTVSRSDSSASGWNFQVNQQHE
eukprot:1104479-Lingulodinium_polyedra.AAC.1